MRIVSLLPSATEIICALGLGEQLVGVTHECDHPPQVLHLPRVTHTLIPTEATSLAIDGLVRERLQHQRALYTLNLPVLESLRPDLIVTQALCDVCAVAAEEVQAAACALPGSPRVLNLEPTTLAQVLASLVTVAQAAGISEQGAAVVANLRQRIQRVVDRVAARPRRRVVLLEWIDPPFSCGHWSPELVALAGGVELIGQPGQRSRTLTWDEVLQAQPEVLVLACCGFSVERTRQDLPILEAQPRWAELPCVRTGAVHVVDGSAYFSRPGPRLVDSLEILADLLHPCQSEP